MDISTILAFYVAPLAVIWGAYGVTRRKSEARVVAAQQEAIEAGLTEPASLHPIIDASLCIGCKACLNACPEGDILGLIDNKAHLIEPSNCIGHGACKTACPRGAISLVFGTETRGIDLPVVGPDFETDVPGIYIAGELGGMGLIRNAIEQGRQAMDSVAARRPAKVNAMHDVCVIGAGPAGISASLRAKELKLKCLTLEQDSMGGTVAHFPRGKVVMTAPAHLPMIGEVRFKEVQKEKLLSFWEDVIRKTGLVIHTQERVVSIAAVAGGFMVTTTKGQHAARSVLLAIGRRGTPRRLGVPGEDLPKVIYRLIDAEQFRGQHVLVVGGGDSALEAAASLAEQPGTTVTLSYRSEAFGRAKSKNRNGVEEAAREGRLEVLLRSKVTRIGPSAVELQLDGQSLVRRNDAIIVCAGGILPTDFLRSIGIGIETKYGTT
ncbi:MAG: NAD(P)-binding domain-containing protein [Hyphomicrobium sp.]